MEKFKKQREAAVPEPSTSAHSLQAVTVRSIRELGSNSIVGNVRELPENGRAELRNTQSLSVPGVEMSGVVESLPIMVHELGTHRSSQ